MKWQASGLETKQKQTKNRNKLHLFVHFLDHLCIRRCQDDNSRSHNTWASQLVLRILWVMSMYYAVYEVDQLRFESTTWVKVMLTVQIFLIVVCSLTPRCRLLCGQQGFLGFGDDLEYIFSLSSLIVSSVKWQIHSDQCIKKLIFWLNVLFLIMHVHLCFSVTKFLSCTESEFLLLLDVILLHASQLNKYVFTALIFVTFYLLTLIVSSFNLVFLLHCDLKACTSVPRGRSLTVSSVEKSNK